MTAGKRCQRPTRKHERETRSERTDHRGSRDLGEDDVDVTREPKGQRCSGTGDEPTSEAMHLFGILTREDNAVVSGWSNQEDHRHSDTAEARRMDRL